MRLVDIDDIRVMKFLSEEDDPSESDGEREYRNGWNDALTAVNDIQPSVEPDEIALHESCTDCPLYDHDRNSCPRFNKVIPETLRELQSAEPEISRIEKELHGKTPEEQYDFIYWLLLKFGLGYTDSRLAILEWLRGEKEDG